MALYDRLMGLSTTEPKIPVHAFVSDMGEFGRTVITGTQAQAIIAFVSQGVPLDPAGVTEVQALLATVTGSLTAKLARVKLIEDVLILAEERAPGYDTVALVKTRLGV